MADDVRESAAEWMRLGRCLCDVLQFDFGALDEVQRLRVFHYYLPVYMWQVKQMRAHAEKGTGKPLVVRQAATQTRNLSPPPPPLSLAHRHRHTCKPMPTLAASTRRKRPR